MDTQTQLSLSRLLSRLDSQPIPHTSYARAKTSKNLEHARTLLLTLEKQSATIRVQDQRQEAQADLQRKREMIKRIGASLQAAEDEDSEEDEDDSEGERDQRAVDWDPAIQDTDSGLDTGQTPALQAEVLSQQAQQDLQQQQQPSSLRSRKPQPPTSTSLKPSDNHSAATTSSRETLFAGRPQTNNTNLSNSETLLTHNRTEQENLTTSLFSLASALKQSSLQFSSSLESEKETLRRAEGGLDKSAQGMEAAERKMGALRRMSEGQGLWGRIKLYGFIFALWVVCFVFVFAGPKLRS